MKKIKYKKRVKYTQKRRPYKSYYVADWTWNEVLSESLILREKENNFLYVISKKYGIIYETLKSKFYQYLKDNTIEFSDNRGNSNKIFTEEEEKSIADNIKKNFIDKNLPFDNTDLKIMAICEWKKIYLDSDEEVIIDDLNIINFDGLDFHASDGWCTSFKKKWGLSSVRPTKKRISSYDNIEACKKFIDDCKKEYDRVGPDLFIIISHLIDRTIGVLDPFL